MRSVWTPLLLAAATFCWGLAYVVWRVAQHHRYLGMMRERVRVRNYATRSEPPFRPEAAMYEKQALDPAERTREEVAPGVHVIADLGLVSIAKETGPRDRDGELADPDTVVLTVAEAKCVRDRLLQLLARL